MRLWEKKKKPEGWEVIEPTLNDLLAKMREAESEPADGKRRTEAIWPIFQIHHQISRYIWETYKKGEISKDVYNFCIKWKIADKDLIAMWKKKGYEKLCCMACAQKGEHIQGTTCICRVPKADLPAGKIVECCHCGCRGCASGDGSKRSKKREHEEEGNEISKRIEELRNMAMQPEEEEPKPAKEEEEPKPEEEESA
ncbi:hypothetical protein AV274_4473 [Blastocystis sp. ATCC 50177/Nand II]|uniref:G10 protein n=1 Tax=Blastocystis sp. subtype 1 (strain ATCC 50177 / NandII) TaxID=478820 RepID=A0A196S9U7_BLAHN|nr:hypothetical protein AV274_4473 [Blastocystis sp. ATCC 50177/Nand II]